MTIFGFPLQDILFYMLPLVTVEAAFEVSKKLDTDKLYIKLLPFLSVIYVLFSCSAIYEKGLVGHEVVGIMTLMFIFSFGIISTSLKFIK